MSRKRRVHSAAFKGKVALEALKELKPINVLASQYEIQPNQISTWKKQLKEGISEIFSRKRGKAKEDTRKAEKCVWRVPYPVRGSQHEFKYRLALVVDGRCVLRYDNEAGKGDHKHLGDEEIPYAFTSPQGLLDDFWNDVDNWED